MDIAKPDHATPSCGIAIMAKASVPGRAKTRLVPPLTFAEAAAFNSAFLKDVAANVLAAADSADIAGYVAFGPPGADAVAFFQRLLPRRIGLIEAWFPNFGDCLSSAVAQLLDRGHASAVVLNSDSPTLPTSLLVETARVLAQPGDCAVLGPSIDGGYYLLGVKQPHRPPVRGRRLEHRAGGPPNLGARGRDRPARPCPAALVRRRRRRGIEHAAVGIVRGCGIFGEP
jgi:glycosyltransferase A (GT-A) superfamily protein (DUF2064 family)